jgi:pyrroline-5-carboxylate reductase
MKATVFLGGGRITSALVAGLRLAGYKSPIVVHDRNLHKLRALKREFGLIAEPSLLSAVAQARLLIIAVRPSDVAAVLTAIRRGVSRPGALGSKPALIACSLAAGIPLANLRSMIGPPARWVRAMPSPVARTGRGLTALTFERGFPAGGRKLVKQFFAHLGPALEIPEHKFDAFTVAFSPSHGYHALATLAQGAQILGLDRATSFAAAAHALADGIVAWREGRESLEALLREAATPGGIAATVMKTMDSAGYSRSIERGLRAGVARARKNAKL